MRNHILCPLAALALGCGGAALRMWEATSYPGEAPIMTFALCTLVLAVFSLMAARLKRCRGGALFTRDKLFSPAALILSAVLLAASAMFRLAQAAAMAGIGPNSEVSPIQMFRAAPLGVILSLFAVPAVVSLAFLAKDALKGEGKSMGSIAPVFPVLFCWVWLLDFYRANTSNPIISDYILPMAAVIFSLLSAHGRAGFSFKDGSPFLTLFSGLCTIALFPIVLTHDPEPIFVLTCAAFFCSALCTVISILRDLPMPEIASETDIQTETEEPSDE